jgi:hypothetical protein
MTAVSGAAVPTMHCAVCGTDVPAGAFCGTCGAHLSARRGNGRGLLRPVAYAAAPGEHTLRLSVVSSLFPHLPHRSRIPFRLGLGVLLIAFIAFGFLRWQAPLVVVSGIGFPLLFLLYVHEADIDDDMPRSSLLWTAALGIGLGVGYALLTGPIVAASYDVAVSEGAPRSHPILSELLITTGAAVLMLVPAVVIRLWRPGARESLDGFVIGALGATNFIAAGTLTRLAPELATGPMADSDRPVHGLLVQAGIQGVTVPLTAAAMGGLVGAALWFSRPADDARRRSHTNAMLVSSVLVALLLYVAMGLLEASPQFEGLHFGLHVLIAVIAVLVLRIGLQAALLHEAHDDINPDQHVLCPHCDHIIPDMAFCPNCGVAARAASRTSRRARRNPSDTAVSEARPAYALPAGSYAAEPVRQTSHARLLVPLTIGTAAVAAAGVAISVLVTPTVPRVVCPPDCGRPPIGTPVQSNPLFVSPDGRFSVQYPGPGTVYEATLNPDGVALNYTTGDTGSLDLYGMAADGKTAKQVAEQQLKQYYPDATVDYEVPNAMVGYEPGYGIVADDYPQDSSGTYTRLRMVLMVAVKHDYALVAWAVGPYHRFTPKFGSGHPSGVNLELALDMGKYVNSFTWRDDSPH